MAFRQRRSTWPGALDQSRKELEAIGVPDPVLRAEKHFIDYLTLGSAQGTQAQLNDLTKDQFWKLFDIVTAWYDMDTLNFTAYQNRINNTPDEE